VKKGLPYVVAGLVGILVAVLLFGPGMSEPERKERAPKPTRAASREEAPAAETRTEAPEEEEKPKTSEEVVRAYRENPPPPPGTLRPMNQAEIEQEARLARGFNQHYAYVASWWTRAAQIVMKKDPELGGQIAALEQTLRDQSNLNEIDEFAVITQERALIRELQASELDSPELDAILSYIDQSAGVVLQGGDPTTVPKPKIPR
jgi:hypothetical protein